jgi:hypothetical protein
MRFALTLLLCLTLPAHAEGFLTRLLNKPVPGGVAVVDLGNDASAPTARYDGKPVLVLSSRGTQLPRAAHHAEKPAPGQSES